MTVHRFIAEGLKNHDKTACRIKLYLHATPDKAEWVALDGKVILTAEKGQPFDCKRCIAVIETFRRGRVKYEALEGG